ncbi:MAG: UDP-N-acetylglucosamine pyrophosphorylase, partial [Deltaproteobacteria bacterium]|nr:UDP-N-acetylglucosamine pyrophosphorylase [Deltaproteobacteria bacterium]
MELKPKCNNKIIQLINKGVDMPNPLTIDMDEAVNVDQISGNGVKMYPGCRIYGDKTVITAGSKIGYEGPVTIENCQIGPGVELKGGYFKNAVFLKKASMGLGAHIREGCILEEQANGAHCVGLKQTILFPFVTLGSLINFCDCLMAGGTSRNDHSEVGSSYIHFNFTPDGDKTTASLIGEVPRGVMLNQPPIFLGGQGGIVGPVRLGYGNVVAAGTILRSDLLEDNRLIVGKPHRGAVIRFVPKSYPGLSRVVGNNLRYIANLLALEQWYIHVRRSFFNGQEFGELIYAGALDKLTLAKRERIKRLKAMAGNMPETTKRSESNGQPAPGKVEFRDKIQQVCELFTEDMAARKGIEHRDRFLNAFDSHKENNAGNYIHTVQSLPHAVSQEGTRWLDQIVDGLCHKAGELLPSLVL